MTLSTQVRLNAHNNDADEVVRANVGSATVDA